jgi:AcrR family transcriptional regulator
MQISADGCGLRERKRRRTRQTIARVALELFDRHGFHETTIPQIAEAADVSPRTVSAYFPHKEDLAFPGAEVEFASLDARLRDRQPGESATEALGNWMRSHLQEEGERAAERQIQRRVIRADEGLCAYEHRFILRVQEILAEAIARDLGVPADDLEPRMAAAATVTIFELLGKDYEAGVPGAVGDARDPHAEALAEIDRALLFIGGGIQTLRAAPPGDTGV